MNKKKKKIPKDGVFSEKKKKNWKISEKKKKKRKETFKTELIV